ncbi:MAG: spore coat associated protein CotJA [Lacrimispora sp.]|uniref:spore coat associated protein CotJA n=1 Tax=Lacrimispora sp. TaxID=2719234 RepID=UPI0039E41863
MDCYTKQSFPEAFSGMGEGHWGPAMEFDMSMVPGTVIRPDMPLGSGPARTDHIPVDQMSVGNTQPPVSPCPWIHPMETVIPEEEVCLEEPQEVSSTQCPSMPEKCCPTKCPSAQKEAKQVCPAMPEKICPAKCPAAMPEKICPAKCPAMPEKICPAKCPAMPREIKPVQCPPMPERICPAKCPSMPEKISPAKCPAMPEKVCPAKCPSMPCPSGNKCESPMMCPDSCARSARRKRPEMPMCNPPAMPYENIDQFPVGMAYVPWQQWQQVYSVETAINRGTIFPDLDKPFTMEGCRR